MRLGLLSCLAILCFGIPTVHAQTGDPETGDQEIVSRTGGGVVSAIQSLPTILAGVLSGLDRVQGNNLEEKSRNLASQFACLKGESNQAKMRTAKALLEAGQDLKSGPEQTDWSEKLEIAKRYWPTVIRPLGGLDGTFNTGDTGAILGCLSQAEIDGIAHELVVAGVYPIINNEAAARVASLRPFVRRIAYRRGLVDAGIANAQSMAHGTYQGKSAQIRQELETRGKEAIDRHLRDLFRVTTSTPFEEPVCRADDPDSYSRLSLRHAMAFAHEMNGIDFMRMGADAIWAKFYGQAMPSLPQVPKEIAIPGTNIELRFPKGIPLSAIEEAVVNGKLPASLSLSVREERRKVDGKEKTARVIEIGPQNTVFGINVEQSIFQRPDGKYVAYGVISNVFPGSPAEKAGLKVGDYIKTMHGKEMGKVLNDTQAASYERGEELDDLGVTAAIVNESEQRARHADRTLPIELRTLQNDGQSRRTRALSVQLNQPCGGELSAEAFPHAANDAPH